MANAAAKCNGSSGGRGAYELIDFDEVREQLLRFHGLTGTDTLLSISKEITYFLIPSDTPPQDESLAIEGECE
jgi:hypothetical protein